MCWNKEISFITLAVGTLFNIILWFSTTNWNVRIVAILWQYVLLMQLFEGLSWISKQTNNPLLGRIATHGAFWANVTQPLRVGCLCLFVAQSDATRSIVVMLMIAYAVSLARNYQTIDLTPDLYSDQKCGHLSLYWWRKLEILPLFLTLLAVGTLSIMPVWFGALEFGYIFMTLALSTVVYPCTYGGIWCWFAAFAPIWTWLVIKIHPIN